ncbi:hypothetical protein DMA11_10220 [Marinilabiliaceae bacterium JC017]|nr:hypothetical protein DMA11_10220 [Marinilabiliaceae bacterium JC017]
MKSILYTPEMFTATIQGRKTQTRRLEKSLANINKKPGKWEFKSLGESAVQHAYFKPDYNKDILIGARPKYFKGDICYLREGFRIPKEFDKLKASEIKACPVEYRNGGTTNCIGDKISDPGKWRSPYHLPAHLARYFVKITNVKAERIKNIKDEECIAEGINICCDIIPNCFFPNYTKKTSFTDSSYASFKSLWISLYGEESWKASPWVFVYTQQLCDREGKEVQP